jgi:general stress protein YciG
VTAEAPKKRGFAAMSPEKQREIAARGGKAAHKAGTAHTFSADEAKAAGKKGGAKVAYDRAHMAEIGRIGGTTKAKGKPKDETKTED